MTIIQTTARVPEEYRDLILRVSARIREDAEFPAKLEALLLESMGAPVAYQFPPEMVADMDRRVEEAKAAIRHLEEESKKLADTLAPYRALARAANGGALKQLIESMGKQIKGMMPPAVAPFYTSEGRAQTAMAETIMNEPDPPGFPSASPAEETPQAVCAVPFEVTPIPATTKRKKPAPTVEQKAERKAFATELREAPGAQGLGIKDLVVKLSDPTGINPSWAQSILSGSVGSSPELRNKLRIAVGLEPKELPPKK